MIAKLIVGVVGVTLCLTGEAMSAEIAPRVVASISGNHLRAIQAALPEISARKLDLTRYEVTVLESATSLIILFDSPNRQEGERGSMSGDQPAFEVEVNKKTNQIVRSNYVR